MTALASRLADYPHVVVRLACPACEIARSYRLARLASAYGAERTMDEVLDRLLKGCGPRSAARGRDTCRGICSAHFPDLEAAPRMADPGAKRVRLRLVVDGRR